MSWNGRKYEIEVAKMEKNGKPWCFDSFTGTVSNFESQWYVNCQSLIPAVGPWPFCEEWQSRASCRSAETLRGVGNKGFFDLGLVCADLWLVIQGSLKYSTQFFLGMLIPCVSPNPENKGPFVEVVEMWQEVPFNKRIHHMSTFRKQGLGAWPLLCVRF